MKVFPKSWCVLTIFMVLVINCFVSCKKGNPVEPIPTTPVVRLVSPTSSSLLQDSVLVEVEATDDKGVVKVEVYIDSQIPQGGTLLIAPYKYIWNTSSYADSSAHTLFAKAYDADGNVSTTPVLTLVLYKFAPSNLTATAVSDTLVRLTWKDNSRKEDGFTIERSSDGVNFLVVDSTVADVITRAVAGAYLANTAYFFRVRAKSANSYSAYSNTASVSFTFAAPTGLTASFAADTSITIRWTDNSTFETGFLIERSTDGIHFTVVDSVSANVTSKSVVGVYVVNTTYWFRVRAKSANNYSAYSNTLSAMFNLVAPSGLTASFLADTALTLRWTDNTTFETGFLIERSTDGVSFLLIDSVGANVTSKSLPGVYLTTSTYSFRVRAKSANNFSAYSNTAVATLTFAPPSGLTVSSITEALIALRWTDNSTFETGFLIERSTDGVNFSLIDSVSANVTTESVFGVYLTTTTYSFRVRAKSASNYSGYSNIAMATVSFPAPSNLIVTSITPTSANLQWTDNSIFETGFLIERSTNGVNFVLVDSTVANTTSRLVAGVYLLNTTYSFRVRAKSANNYSPYSNTVQVTLTFTAPSNLTVTSVSETSVGLQWTDNSTFETGFLIERSTDGVNFSLIDSVGANVTTKSLSGVYLMTTTYSFRVRAKSANNYSPYSNAAQVTLTFTAPSALTVSFVTDTAITLQWTDNSTFETGFLIERSTDGVNFVLVDSVGANVTAKSVAGVYRTGMTYSFRVRAKSAYNVSAYSNVAQVALTFTAPSNLTVTVTTTSASLQWTDNSTFETGFLIERSTDGVNFVLVDSVGADVTGRAVAGVYLANTTYSFRVRAKSVYNVSAYSNVSASSPYVWMVTVVGGAFQMGSNDVNDYGASPPHSVTLSTFYIDKTEITYEKWTDVRNWGLTHGYTDLVAGANGSNPVGTNNPVTYVNWYDILKWCNARSEKDGLTAVYYTSNTLSIVYRTGEFDLAAEAVNWTANGYRLPTEAEWEFAARGGINSAYYDYTYGGSNIIDSVAWYRSNSGNNTHPVSTKGANKLGLYDMSGNAWEWCWDWYGAYSSTAQTDPRGPTSGTYRLLRGGSFNYLDYGCRVDYRGNNLGPRDRYSDGGFRCVQH